MAETGEPPPTQTWRRLSAIQSAASLSLEHGYVVLDFSPMWKQMRNTRKTTHFVLANGSIIYEQARSSDWKADWQVADHPHFITTREHMS